MGKSPGDDTGACKAARLLSVKRGPVFFLSQQNLFLDENQSPPCAFAHPVSRASSPGVHSPTSHSGEVNVQSQGACAGESLV